MDAGHGQLRDSDLLETGHPLSQTRDADLQCPGETRGDVDRDRRRAADRHGLATAVSRHRYFGDWAAGRQLQGAARDLSRAEEAQPEPLSETDRPRTGPPGGRRIAID